MDKNENAQRGSLYIVATPIGNLEDISLRAIRILKEVDVIAAEDTRRTKKLLDYYKIETPLISLHEHNEREKSKLIIAKIMLGKNAAYVSDAGTPCISDPGQQLVDRAHNEKVKVIPIPGPSAVITALSASGFTADNFLFCGFLPSKENKRRQLLELLKEEERTIIFYESPARILSALRDVHAVLGSREILIARELTKVFEEIRRGKTEEFFDIGINAVKEKGEYTVVIKGSEKTPIIYSVESIEKKLRQSLKEKDTSLRDAVAEVVNQTGMSRKMIYDIALRIQE